MRVLVAMSGGVDSSVAAALLAADGHEVVGATLKLWGGSSDSGCCSVADVEDARRVAQQLGITHHVFNMTEEFETHVVGPYVAAHAQGRTPNPCIECNRRIKFDRLLERAQRMGFDALATGHHARVSPGAQGAAGSSISPAGRQRLLRGVDPDKDQSYVLAMLGQDQLARLLLPIGGWSKADVRRQADRLGLRTAHKPDSQDVCFIHSGEGRGGFLGRRIELRSAPVVDRATGRQVGEVDAVELVTVGQRRGMGHGEDGRRRYVLGVEPGPVPRVLVGGPEDVVADHVALVPGSVTWVDDPVADGCAVIAQLSAHGRPARSTIECTTSSLTLRFSVPQRLVAPGQTIAFYDPAEPDSVLGAGIAA